jgi:DNA-binding CsgD family transcriptional regulator/PAS domain-containing protein
MGWVSLDAYDEDRVSVISQNLAAAIDAATFGEGAWDQVPAILSEAFPGSWGGLANMNFPESRLNFLSLQNMDPDFVAAYAEHFAYINPWNAYWGRIKGTTIAASEEVSPAQNFIKTEFYNDWLLPQNRAVAAAGMKFVGESGEVVNLLVHYPLSKSGVYDRATVKVLTSIRGNLERSVNLAHLLRTDVETAVAKAALVERGRCAAFIVDGDRCLREANRLAERLFVSGHGVAVRHGRCHLADAAADARFAAGLKQLSQGEPSRISQIGFRTATGAWQVSIAALPTAQPPGGARLALLPPRRMVLVLVVDLGARGLNAGSLEALGGGFGLTQSEIAFCKRLLLGETIAEAAEQLGITQGTARTRLKAIFQKTGTSRQAELMLLLVNMS